MIKANENVDFFSKKMFSRLLAPSLISYIGLAFGDVADAVVVGNKLGVTGLAAISLALPVFMIINVIMHGFGSGGAIIYSRLMGEGKHKEAVSSFNSVLRTSIIISVILAIVGNIFMEQLLKILGTVPKDGDLYNTAFEYINIIVTGMPVIMIGYILNYYLRNSGSEKLASLGFTVANIVDISLNIIFVLILEIGVKGAAYATVIGQMVAIVFYLPSILKKKNNLYFSIKGDNLFNTFKCFRVGFSSSVQYVFTFIFILSVNNILMVLSGDVGVAIFDLIQNVSFLVLYLYEGVAKASQPLVSTFCGERNTSGQKTILTYSIVSGTIAGGVAILIIAVFPEFMCNIFGLIESSVLDVGIYALRVYCTGALFAGLNVLLESYEQACENEEGAFFIALLRGAIILIPVTFIFAFFGIKVFWWLFPITELISFIVFFLWKKFTKKEKAFDKERVYSCTIANSFEDMEVLMNNIDEFCEKWNAEESQKYYVVMTIEELCVAIMKQFEEKDDGRIQITFIANEDKSFELHIRDNAVLFNPFELDTNKADEDFNFDMDAMGMLVIKETAKNFYYRRYQGFNTLVVRI
ncbi:MAG: multidrug transporter [Lachnospiraceae bacterium]|nr:multidrug transporter [Lachnospiraceae bacterium]